MAGDRLEHMVATQMDLQSRLGNKYAAMTVEERIDHIRTMALAAILEIGEAMNEVTWKPWSSAAPDINGPGVASELNDAWQFICNMWFAVLPNATPAQIADIMHYALRSKHAINHGRIDRGYDNTDKCPACKRAYDDTYVTCVRKVVNHGEGTNDIPAFCDQAKTYVSSTGEPMGFGASGWYVVTP